MKKGFTLAEVMITLTVIGIITAIVLPVAFHSKPDENVMKFKKAHNTLYQVITTLINSDEYYLDGDLGKTPDGRNIDYKVDEKFATYFCNTLADVLTTKKVNCSSYFTRHADSAYFCSTDTGGVGDLDAKCKLEAKNIGEEIKLSNGTIMYQLAPGFTFGYSGGHIYSDPEGAVDILDVQTFYLSENKEQGEAYRCSKILCIDIDGIPTEGSKNCDDKKDICPFGYGIRVDGKITTGQRATEWLNKNIQNAN